MEKFALEVGLLNKRCAILFFMNTILITKADGTQEPFNVNKLVGSLTRAGASEEVTKKIIEDVSKILVPEMATKKIYQHAFSLLRKKEKTAASRYSMRRAVLALGPTGFPFEDFISEMYRAKGYMTKTRVVLRGKCVSHELDLVASNGEDCFVAEAKFHNGPGVKTDLKVALYMWSRFQDLKGQEVPHKGYCPVSNVLLITNTKFTHNAQNYAKCVGLDMISWNYPVKGNLQDLIDEAQVQPITCLTTLSTAQKRKLLQNNTILCRTLIKNKHKLDILKISDAKKLAVLDEIALLCG